MTELFSIKAGRAFRREGSNFIDSESTRGTLVLEAGDDDLLYLRWRARDGDISTREDLELVIFPSDAKLERISEDPSVRMYVLKFQSSDQLHFDPDSAQDTSHIEKINNIMLNFDSESLSGPTESIASNNSVQAPTGPLNPEQLNSVVQEILRNLQGHSRAGVAPDVALSDILTPSILATVLQDSEVVNSLTQFLPVELLSSPYATQVPLQEVMKQTVASAPFRSSVRSLDQALSTGLLGGLVTSLGMPVEAGLGIHPFLEAIEKQARGHGKTTRDKQGDEKKD
ncbi:proteasome complex subunit rpn13 ubiquitin receptor domain-containing protein [Rhizoctonia solani AG-1 IA]|uniref:Proteasome complex subunit rpn13 ubiquitin receptor domain-containing protein n=1 Tax=Thanatephorus cucumeris (strain AG1-IA) TaxID=983506 RepID=L8X4S3_THACA|nr:proteasome complex subunit rpn13 ubiquitin receptor domain-containing protein [Rhizoctonia solani AG-1 IA]